MSKHTHTHTHITPGSPCPTCSSRTPPGDPAWGRRRRTAAPAPCRRPGGAAAAAARAAATRRRAGLRHGRRAESKQAGRQARQHATSIQPEHTCSMWRVQEPQPGRCEAAARRGGQGSGRVCGAASWQRVTPTVAGSDAGVGGRRGGALRIAAHKVAVFLELRRGRRAGRLGGWKVWGVGTRGGKRAQRHTAICIQDSAQAGRRRHALPLTPVPVLYQPDAR